MDLQGFNALEVSPSKPYEPIPAGNYNMVFISAQEKANKANTGSYLQLDAQVIEGEYANRKVIVRLNLKNANATAVEIAKAELSAICRAVNVPMPKVSSDLLNKPFMGKLKVVTARGEYSAGNEIAGYEAVPKAPAANVASSGKPPFMA
jgi:hypothetical protein